MPKKAVLPQDPKWKRFEKVVAGIHIVTDAGAKVKFNDHLRGRRSGEKWQVDVSIRYKQGFYEHLAIIECKDTTKAVGVKEVQAFNTKMDDLGANKGVMVASKGFQSGAVKTAAAYGIELYTLKEEPGEWLKRIVSDVTAARFPIEFSIRAEEVEGCDDPQSKEIDDFVFYTPNGAKLPLQKFINDGMAEATKCKLIPPYTAEFNFESPYTILLPGCHSTTKAYGLTIKVGALETVIIPMEVPADRQLVNYVFTNVAGQEKHVFPDTTLPVGIGNSFTPGEFYVDALNMKYRCVDVSEEEVQLMLLDSKQRGGSISALFTASTNTARHYRPLNDSQEAERLEEIYRRLEGG